MGWLGEALLVAAHSAIATTDLEPNLIYDGPRNPVTEYLEGIGVRVHYHAASFRGSIPATNGGPYEQNIARGAFLSFDITLIDSSNDTVLYTDADVIFVKSPSYRKTPTIIAAAPEYAAVSGKMIPYPKVFNSGVMVINLAAFRDEVKDLIALATEHGFYLSGYDQSILNAGLAGRWEELPQSMNWRGFGMGDDQPEIMHFHGTKPHELADISRSREACKNLFSCNPSRYLRMVVEFARYSSSPANDILREAFPTARILLETPPAPRGRNPNLPRFLRRLIPARG